MMRVSVDAARCQGHGRCYDLGPEVFDADDEGFEVHRGTVFEVEETHLDAVSEGIAGCPERAIRLEEGESD